jgi:hypothetical protein
VHCITDNLPALLQAINQTKQMHHCLEAIAEMQYKSQLFTENSTKKERLFYLLQTERL